MLNDFEIRGEVTALIIKLQNGEALECLIDTDDLPRLIEFNHKWSAIRYRRWLGSTDRR